MIRVEMMSDSYSVVMTGKVAEGQDPEQVKANVGKLFRIDEQQLNRMFAGKPVAVRKGISREQADKICAALMKAGAEAKVRSVKPRTAQPDVTPQPAAIKAVAPATEASAEPKVASPKTASPKAAAETPKPAAAKSAGGDFTPDLECPRCGHEQAFTTQCGLCKMDLTLHIQRLRRKEKARAFRREAASAAN